MHMYGSASEDGTRDGMTMRMDNSVRSAIMYVAKSGAARTNSKRTSLVLSSKARTASRPSSARTFRR